jgi:Cu2+-exporting ATPase
VLLAWFAMMQVMMFAYPAWVAEAGTLAPDAEQWLRLASLVVTTPTLWFCGGPILWRTLMDLRRGMLGLDVPL